MRTRFALVAVLVVETAARADIWEPLTEQPGAVDAAAADLAKATQSEASDKQAARYQFAQIAHAHPAALHECYLGLAHVRVGELTEAKLALDIAAAMGGARPKWCTGAVADELAKALADKHFVEIAIDVTPHDAIVNLNNWTEVRGVTSVWWRPDDHVGYWVSAPGYQTQNANLPLGSPSVRLAVTLVPEAHEEPAPPPVVVDAGVQPPPPPPPAATPQPLPPPPPATGLRDATLGVTIAAAAAAGVTLYLTHYYHDQANDLYPSDPRFADAHTGWEVSRDFALGTAALAVISGGVYAYLAITGDRALPNLDQPGLHVGTNGVGWSWTFR